VLEPMTPELEELARLYEARAEAIGDDKILAKHRFDAKCAEFAASHRLNPEAVRKFAATAFIKAQASADRRSGRPPQPH